MAQLFSNTLLLTLLIVSPTIAQIRYFPPNFPANWYESDLKAMKEPSLWESSKKQKTESYRFVWLRSFHNPVSIRIDLHSDGTSLLIRKMTTGVTGRAGRLIQNETFTLDHSQTSRFLERIEQYRFWKLPPVLEDRGDDGAQWIIEGVRDGNYHIADRWSPKAGEIRVLGLYMVRDLAKLRLTEGEIY